ncbi:MAG: hypothetical protein AB7O26_10340, partial [Planctomycetaceae bacterium]
DSGLDAYTQFSIRRFNRVDRVASETTVIPVIPVQHFDATLREKVEFELMPEIDFGELEAEQTDLSMDLDAIFELIIDRLEESSASSRNNGEVPAAPQSETPGPSDKQATPKRAKAEPQQSSDENLTTAETVSERLDALDDLFAAIVNEDLANTELASNVERMTPEQEAIVTALITVAAAAPAAGAIAAHAVAAKDDAESRKHLLPNR